MDQSEKPTRSRLGRGLSSLMAVDESISASNAATMEVAIDQIAANPHQPRQTMLDKTLEELAQSIKVNGIIQPLIVRQAGSGFELIAGERRLRAAKLAGLSQVPVVVKESDTHTQAQLALVENIQREDLNPMERALAYHAIAKQLGLSANELAARLGEERSGVANYLRLVTLPSDVQDQIRNGTLSLGHAKVLAGVVDPQEQSRLARLTASEHLTVRNLEKAISDPIESAPTGKTRKPSAHLKDLESSLTQQLGLRVHVKAGPKGKGRLVIHYSSLDQFDELCQRLGVTATE